MDRRIPQYFNSVPADNISKLSVASHASSTGRMVGDQQPRMVQEPPSQWSRAATAPASTAVELTPRRRLRVAATDSGPPVEDAAADSSCSSATLSYADWSTHPSRAYYPPPESLLVSNQRSTASHTPPGRRKLRGSRTPPFHAKVRRVHHELTFASANRLSRHDAGDIPRERTPFASPSAPSGGSPAELHPPSIAHPALTNSRNPVVEDAVRIDSHGLERFAQTSAPYPPGKTEPFASSHGDMSTHSYDQHKYMRHLGNFSRATFFQDNKVTKLDSYKGSAEFPGNSSDKVLPHFMNRVSRKQGHSHSDREVHNESQNESTADSGNYGLPYLKSVQTSLEYAHLNPAQGYNFDTSKDSVSCTFVTEPKIPHLMMEQGLGQSRSFPNYYKPGHYCHSISCCTSTSISEGDRHSTVAFDLTTTQSDPSRAFTHSKLSPPQLSQGSSIDRSCASSSQIGLSNVAHSTAMFGASRDSEETDRLTTQSIPLHTSLPCSTASLVIQDAPSDTLSYPRSGRVESDVAIIKVPSKQNECSYIRNKCPQTKQPFYDPASRKLTQETHSASYYSSSCASDRSRNSVTVATSLSASTSVTTCGIRSLSGVRDSKTHIEHYEKDNTCNEQCCSIYLPIPQKKYADTCHLSQLHSSDPHSQTYPTKTTSNPTKDHTEKISSATTPKEHLHQPNLEHTKLPHGSSKTKISTGGTRRRRRHAVGLICGVCGDSARSLHFGGVSCDSCKAFFRRAVIAKAYPSFLCVTTGQPPQVKYQKSVKSGDQSHGPSEVLQESPQLFFKDSSRNNSSMKDPQRMVQLPPDSGEPQITSSFLCEPGTRSCDRLSYDDENICSVTKASTVDTNTRSLESGALQLSSGVNQNVIAPDCVTSPLNSSQEITSSEISSGMSDADAGQKTVNTKDKQLRHVSKQYNKCPPITVTTRKYCQACRFQRCIDIGMEISWVTLETDAQKMLSNQPLKRSFNQLDITCRGSHQNPEIHKSKYSRRNGDPTLNMYLTRDEQRQIEDLVNIYRSVFWGVPEPSYHRPALIDFPPPFVSNDVSVTTDGSKYGIASQSSHDSKSASSNQSTSHSGDGKNGANGVLNASAFTPGSMTQSSSIKKNSRIEVEFHSSDPYFQQQDDRGVERDGDNSQNFHGVTAEQRITTGDHLVKSNQTHNYPVGDTTIPSTPTEEEENSLFGMPTEDIVNLPKNPLGVNMFRKALIRRPRPWLIRQLMGYTLRFLYVVLKLLKSVGRTLSIADRTILLRQGMTGLTFMNSVFTYDTDVEGWPERVFPTLPLVLQDEESGSTSDQPDYLQGAPMHADEVASVVAPDVLEHQLIFIRGMKVLVGADCTSLFMLMAIMLFDPTYEGLEQPQIVEDIQGNYCHLLKQYVSWKFKNGPPPNPGLDRPFNFTPLPSLLQNIDNPENSTTGAGHVGNLTSGRNEETTLLAEEKEASFSWSTMGTSDMKEKTTASIGGSNVRDIFRFERPEGTYYSPPYPPSPINPSSIYPFLMTRLADLKQIAHGYSSTPFLLQGSEVDEIANLVARIEIFMSDVIATEPEPDYKDKDGSGGAAGGYEENQEYDGKEHNPSKPEEQTHSRENESFNQILSGEKLQQDRIDGRYGRDWDYIPENDFEWDSYSSADDSTSTSSHSAMSIGSSFSDIASVLEVNGGEGVENEMECGPEEVFESLGIWEKDHFTKSLDLDGTDVTGKEKVDEIPSSGTKSSLNDTEKYFMHPCIDKTLGGGKRANSTLEFNKSVFVAPGNVVCDNFEVDSSEKVQDGAHLEQTIHNMHNIKASITRDDDSVSPSSVMGDHSLEESNCWNKPSHNKDENLIEHLEVDQDETVDENRNLDPTRRNVSKDCMSWRGGGGSITKRLSRKGTFVDEISPGKTSEFLPISKGLADCFPNREMRQEAHHYSLWDRIKATGKALLGLDSSMPNIPEGGSWKGGTNVSEHTILQEGEGDIENWLNPLERPESNSSGYVSTISSPPPLNVQKEFDIFDCGGDWEDLFQKL